MKEKALMEKQEQFVWLEPKKNEVSSLTEKGPLGSSTKNHQKQEEDKENKLSSVLFVSGFMENCSFLSCGKERDCSMFRWPIRNYLPAQWRSKVAMIVSDQRPTFTRLKDKQVSDGIIHEREELTFDSAIGLLWGC